MAIIVRVFVPAIRLPLICFARTSYTEYILDCKLGVVSLALGLGDVCFEVLELGSRFIDWWKTVSACPSPLPNWVGTYEEWLRSIPNCQTVCLIGGYHRCFRP